MFNNVTLEVTDNYGSDMTYRIHLDDPEIASLGLIITNFEAANKDLGYWVTGARYTR
jgi:hypothetical protein